MGRTRRNTRNARIHCPQLPAVVPVDVEKDDVTHAGSPLRHLFESGDMDEDIAPFVLNLDKAEPLGIVPAYQFASIVFDFQDCSLS
jgi:hypothetical protein